MIRYCLVINFTLLLVYGATTAWGGSIKGRVCNDGEMAPDNGLKLATVVLKLADGTERITRTNADGTYEITDVPSGKVTIAHRKDGFARDPTEVHFTVKGDEQLAEVYLWDPNAQAQAYFDIVSGNMLNRIRDKKSRKDAIAFEWVRVTNAQVPLTFKWQLATTIAKNEPALRDDFPVLADYQALDNGRIQMLQAICLGAAKQSEQIARLPEFQKKERLSNQIIADALITTLNSPKLDQEARVEFGSNLAKNDYFAREIMASVKPWAKTPAIKWGIHDLEGSHQHLYLPQR